MRQEIGKLIGDDLLDIPGAEPRLHHRGRIDIDLERCSGRRRQTGPTIRLQKYRWGVLT